MWRKEDGRPQNPNEISTGPVNPTTPLAPAFSSAKDSPASAPVSSKAVACVSQGIRIKGEITGSEDLFIDGNVEGKVSFHNSVLTVGPNATVKADINAREIVVRGRVDGKLDGTDRVQIWSSARINGDIRANRIAIEEGAEIHGKMEAGKAPSRPADAAGSKKPEVSKVKETDNNLDKTAPGAAVAGAD
ncbi:MAG TPA: polymer-forming cytoskeletal protein [Candidatus Acidoferrum sp.]|nr:polymer-forming cytoskeletal protein [Candidatus Acidoferrum sp.]